MIGNKKSRVRSRPSDRSGRILENCDLAMHKIGKGTGTRHRKRGHVVSATPGFFYFWTKNKRHVRISKTRLTSFRSEAVSEEACGVDFVYSENMFLLFW